ncbi:hypothetical protein GCM10007857_77020 [Bradyrhizobium iriomotense]|uniref:Uncharacterized protein n=1 Tax=Bradyrhizobium iriomotense TaxID=441950 RepID=A0ABQ6BAW3_9BRAD|nr:hypothetical protein GCM10007857_77020 [Bradyrhizobium iriomotense]
MARLGYGETAAKFLICLASLSVCTTFVHADFIQFVAVPLPPPQGDVSLKAPRQSDTFLTKLSGDEYARPHSKRRYLAR